MSTKAKTPNEMLEEKQAMLQAQEKRRMDERPLSRNANIAYAKELVATIEPTRGPSPARIVMSSPPPVPEDRIPGSADPSPLGGCFADIAEDE